MVLQFSTIARTSTGRAGPMIAESQDQRPATPPGVSLLDSRPTETCGHPVQKYTGLCNTENSPRAMRNPASPNAAPSKTPRLPGRIIPTNPALPPVTQQPLAVSG